MSGDLKKMCQAKKNYVVNANLGKFRNYEIQRWHPDPATTSNKKARTNLKTINKRKDKTK